MRWALALAVLVAGCAPVAPRMAAPLRYEAGPRPHDEGEVLGQSPEPLEEVPAAELSADVTTLSNGMRVAVIARPGRGVIALRLAFARDVVDLRDPGGTRLGLLPGVYFSPPGSGDGVSSTCTMNGCVVGVDAENGELASGLDTLARVVNGPRSMREDEARRLENALADARFSGPNALHVNRARLLFDGTYYGAVPDPYAGRLTLDDLDQVRDAVLQPRSATLVVVGAASAAEVRAAAEKSLGGWTKPEPPPRTRPALPAMAAHPHIVYLHFKRSQIAGFLVARGPGATDPDFVATRVAAAAVGDGQASVAFSQVREELGAAYSPGAQIGAYRDASAITIGGSFDGEKSIAGLTVLLDAMRDMRNKDLTPKALAGAKATLLGEWRGATSSNEGLAMVLAAGTLVGRPPDPEAVPRAIAGVTVEDVRRADVVVTPTHEAP